MNITVTHTLAPEIIALLQGFTQNQNGGSALPQQAAVRELKAVKTEIPQQPAATNNDEAAETITIEQLRPLVLAKAKTKREEVKALLTEFGADKVTNLDQSKYAPFLTKLNAL